MTKKQKKYLKTWASDHGQIYISGDAQSIIDADAPVHAKKLMLGEPTKDMGAWARKAQSMLKPGGFVAFIGN